MCEKKAFWQLFHKNPKLQLILTISLYAGHLRAQILQRLSLEVGQVQSATRSTL